MDSRTVFNNLLIGALFGILVPYLKGIEYLDLFLLVPYSLLSLFFVIPLVVDAVFDAPGRELPLGALYRSVGSGWITGVAVMWMGIATVSVRAGRLVSPPMAVGLSLAVMSLFASILAAAVSAWTAHRVYDAPTAKGRLRIGFLVLLVGFFAVPHFLHEDTVAWLLQYLTPEGIVRATLYMAPVVAVASVAMLAGTVRR